MRHAEVTEAPAKAGDDILPGGEEREIVGHLFGDRGRPAAQVRRGKDRSQEQGTEHQHSLEEVGPAYSVEPAQESVAHNNCGGNVHRNMRINPQHGVEQGAGCLDA